MHKTKIQILTYEKIGEDLFGYIGGNIYMNGRFKRIAFYKTLGFKFG